jgi:hypothetical protein
MEIINCRAVAWNLRWMTWWAAYAAIRLIILIG